MKKIVTLLLALTCVLTACTPGADEPVSSDSSDLTPIGQAEYSPQPSDANMMRGNAFLDTKDLLTLESFPLQFVLHLTGNLPTSCNKLRVAVSPPDAENKILVDVYSVSNPDAICTQVLAPFDVNISLRSFPTGLYTLWVNGEMVAEFQS